MQRTYVALVGSSSFATSYLPMLDGETFYCTIHDGWSSLRQNPGVEVVLTELPALDTAEFQREWGQYWAGLPHRPRILLILSEESSRAVELVQHNVVDYCLLEPLNVQILRARLICLATYRRSYLLEVSVENRLHSYLQECGISPHLKGYRYLVAAITIAYHQPEVLNNVLSLYETVGRLYGAKPSQVERSIRYAIESAFVKGQLQTLAQISPGVVPDTGRPSNAFFISSSVTYLMGYRNHRISML